MINRKFIITLIVFPLIFCFCRNNITHTAIYIDAQTGNDNNPGTIDRPVKTISEVNKRIRNKATSIFFAGDQEFEGTLILNDIHGIDSVPVLIGSYGEGRAVINGSNKESIHIENCKNIHIRMLDLKGSGRKDGNTTNGLHLQNSNNCIVENIYAEGFQKSGVNLYDCRDVFVRRVIAYGNGFCGNGILVGMSDSVTIDHCTATNNGWDMPRQGNGPVGIWTWMSDHVTIQYCISYRNKTSKGGKDDGGFDLDGGVTNSVIQYCLSYENQGAGYGLFQYPGADRWVNNTIRYCVSINDGHTTEGSGSFFIWNGSGGKDQLSGCMIYNNVAYNLSSPVISFENASDHEDFVFANNIFLGAGEMMTGKNTGSRFIGNIWWNPSGNIRIMKYGRMEKWAEATGQEKLNGKIAGAQVDPALSGPLITDITDPYKLNTLSGYTLLPGSPVRNKGIDLKSFLKIDPPSADFFGNPVPQGIASEPGIYELN